ncbi:DnaB-like helicase C-terminal domain-containing protein [Methylocystis echinoides]|uniref:SF4 helicase domain-containing protein n=1 Tax=Methylocystis echinoides TaxID=29468 RepID=A0A9W6GV71_9HYPH|nr:DnaB-like helicase C-terminal domain-containing protein [Methylocystis echinoides]GLI93672.1 hypothetical protein LMG27198_26640 [Methylocystis echinoides]
MIDELRALGIRIASARPGEHKATCPQCSATRRKKSDECLSVKIEGDRAVYHCHHCGWSGAVRERRDDGYGRFTPKPTASKPQFTYKAPTDEMNEWFAHRGISAATLFRAGVTMVETWMPSCAPGETVAAIAFPFYRAGEVVNVKYRTLDKRFRQEKGAEKILYGLDHAEGCDEIVVVEGELDALSIRECDMPNVVSVPDGAPQKVKDTADPEDAKFSYLANCADFLDKVKTFVIATDADGPGQALAEELARRLGRERCKRVTWPPGRKDANEVLVNDGREALMACIERAEPWPIHGLYAVDDFRAEVHALYDQGRSRALSTGWIGLDQHMTIAPGQLTVVTGIPSHGKSEFLDALAVNLAERFNWSFAVCSFENPVAEHISKLAEKRLDLPFWDGKTPRMSREELDRALDWANEHFRFIRADGDRDTADLDWVLEKCRAAVMRHGVRGVIIDPWNEIEHRRPAIMTESEFIGQALMRLKRFAATRGVHVWLVAHPAKLFAVNGSKEAPVPSLYDISGSANWANKADIGVVVYRNDKDKTTEIHVKKCRFKSIGTKGVVSLNYNPVTGRYYE